MKIVFFGNGKRAFVCLKHLIEERRNIVGVVGIPDEVDQKNTIISLAIDNNIPIIVTEDPNDKDTIRLIKKYNSDIFVLGGYCKILNNKILSIPKRMVMNLHAGKLPEYRGSSPLNWALINGEEEFTISIIKVTIGIDAGPILKEQTFEINLNDNIYDLHEKANHHFPIMLSELINEITANKYVEKAQDLENSSYFPRRFKEDGFILFDQLKCDDVHNKIRALTKPYPCAFSYFGKQKVYFISSRLNEGIFYGEPGRVYRKVNNEILVCCKDKSLWITNAEFEDGSDAIKEISVYDSFSTVRIEILNSKG
tara:strand:+ start:514 stop:1443 length:930 start_codon:yes stop_codon:yes gene_type:complete